jgi:hypothetical protein
VRIDNQDIVVVATGIFDATGVRDLLRRPIG